MYKYFYLLFFVSASSFAQNFPHKDYINKFASYAYQEMQESGVPASITLAQGILESGNGKSELSTNGFNHFGIKCKTSYTGKVMFLDDDDKDDCFRVYESVLDSYKDHSSFLRKNQRYQFLFNLDKKDYKGWARGLKKAGYATNPKYANLLIDIIENNKLNLIDKSIQKWLNAVNDYHNQSNSDTNIEDIVIATEVDEVVQDNQSEDRKYARVYTNKNGSVFVLAKPGDTFEGLKNRHDVWISELKRFNELEASPVYKGGEKIYIRPKKNKASIKEYVVKSKDSLYSIAQEYGIKQKKILRRNKLKSAHQIKAGMRLKLR
ncbi:MAG: glucosaminidase domain-containing protein [Flavobacteriales bacterium]